MAPMATIPINVSTTTIPPDHPLRPNAAGGFLRLWLRYLKEVKGARNGSTESDPTKYWYGLSFPSLVGPSD